MFWNGCLVIRFSRRYNLSDSDLFWRNEIVQVCTIGWLLVLWLDLFWEALKMASSYHNAYLNWKEFSCAALMENCFAPSHQCCICNGVTLTSTPGIVWCWADDKRLVHLKLDADLVEHWLDRDGTQVPVSPLRTPPQRLWGALRQKENDPFLGTSSLFETLDMEFLSN